MHELITGLNADKFLSLIPQFANDPDTFYTRLTEWPCYNSTQVFNGENTYMYLGDPNRRPTSSYLVKKY